jgi:hypothetical protein
MKGTSDNRQNMMESDSNPSALDLIGRQSVRATFRLSEKCINAISILSAQLGIKQKSVFDHLMEDAKVLTDMASELENTEFDRQERVQKTFVISRRSLSFLDSISSKHNAPRDALVEFSVRRLLPLIAKEREKHEKRKKLLNDIEKHFSEGQKLLLKAQESLGTDDLIVRRMQSATSVYQNALNDISSFIDRGKVIENF